MCKRFFFTLVVRREACSALPSLLGFSSRYGSCRANKLDFDRLQLDWGDGRRSAWHGLWPFVDCSCAPAPPLRTMSPFRKNQNAVTHLELRHLVHRHVGSDPQTVVPTGCYLLSDLEGVRVQKRSMPGVTRRGAYWRLGVPIIHSLDWTKHHPFVTPGGGFDLHSNQKLRV